jgi:hypothetical protein
MSTIAIGPLRCAWRTPTGQDEAFSLYINELDRIGETGSSFVPSPAAVGLCLPFALRAWLATAH